MKRFFTYILISGALLCTGMLTSCLNSSSSSSTTSSVAQLNTFYLSNSNFPDIANTTFKIEEGDSIGHIYNPDSVSYDSRMGLDTCRPYFTFEATPGSAVLRQRDTVVNLTGTDTLSFMHTPDTLVITSSDGTTVKTYILDVLWHHFDPYLFTWKNVTQSVYPQQSAQQRLILTRDNRMMLFINGGDAVRLFCSEDKGQNWTENKNIQGLPAGCIVQTILYNMHNQEEEIADFYYAEKNTLYYSADGIDWKSEKLNKEGYTFEAPLFCFPDELGNECPWFVFSTTASDKLQIGYYNGMDDFSIKYEVGKGEFPVSGFSAFRFRSTSNRSRVMVMGGYDVNGRMLNTRWNLEHSTAIGLKATDFSHYASQFPKIANSSVVWYDDRLMLFGAIDSLYQYVGRDVYYSIDEGMNWVLADTAKCQLPEAYTSRKNVCAVSDDVSIYLLGGQDNTTHYSDLYQGYINEIIWQQ